MKLESTTESRYAASQCLHLGRSGRRCARPAQEDGFCERHGPDAAWRFAFTARRRIIAIVLGFIVLWPILVDLYHAIHH